MRLFCHINSLSGVYRIEHRKRRSTVAVTINNVKERTSQSKDKSTDFEALFQKHWNRVYAVLFRLVGDHAEAEDLALEVFWRLYRTPPKNNSSKNISGWLYRVATNLGYNELRSTKRRSRYEQEAGYKELVDNKPLDPSAEVERTMQREQVRQILVKMKPRSAKMLVLRHSGLSYAEIAVTLDVSLGSVGTMLARAEREFAKIYLAEFGNEI
jgi:RNA polymerase sigma-70 factor (ECF subfamily)